MDVGSSTGGFTDCMLQNGAVKVYSVDVGHGQLAWNCVTMRELYAWKKLTYDMLHQKMLLIR